MVVFPNCKINLGLHIIRKRNDGFHDLETVFYPLMIKDALEVITSENSSDTSIQFTSTGLAIAGPEENNLCIKAYNILKKDFPTLPSIQMHLHKAIPMGAGLGGGSADGAFALQMLNNQFNLALSKEQLIVYALQLGSDCPFFIINKPCFATSRGEVMKEIDLNLSNYQFVIVNPNIHVNTGWAFSQIKPAASKKSIAEILLQPIATWNDELINDFEAPVAALHPQINNIKKIMYNNGAAYAAMSGTGSTVFGLFEKNVFPQLKFEEGYFVKIV